MKRYCTTVAASLFALLLIATTALAQGVSESDRISRAREEERAQNLVARRLPNDNLSGTLVAGAWWTNTTVVAELGLTEDQKTKIARAFESHSRTIVFNTGALEKEELQLARLMEAESIDHTAVSNQTNRVIQARSEMERETAAMTLEMREQLSRTQWMKLKTLDANLSADRLRLRTQTPAPTPGGQRRQ